MLEREFFRYGLFYFCVFVLIQFSFAVNFIAFDIDCFIWFNGTRVLTRTAADTEFISHFGNAYIFIRYHVNCFSRTVLRTSSAISPLGFDNAIPLFKMCFAQLQCFLFLQSYLLQCSSRANFRTNRALKTAIVIFIIEYRLHESCQTIFAQRWL